MVFMNAIYNRMLFQNNAWDILVSFFKKCEMNNTPSNFLKFWRHKICNFLFLRLKHSEVIADDTRRM